MRSATRAAHLAKRIAAFVLCSLLLLLGACSDDASSELCEASSDCPTPGQLCLDGSCAPCVESSACEADPELSSAGSTQCREGLCTPCVDGEVGCACLGDSCTAGECVGSICTDCRRGSPGCVCRLNGSCDPGASCSEDGLCADCDPGTESCRCDDAGQCGEGLVCDDALCVPDTCEAGTVDCPCAEGDACGADLYCDEGGLCRSCSPDVAGWSVGSCGRDGQDLLQRNGL